MNRKHFIVTCQIGDRQIRADGIALDFAQMRTMVQGSEKMDDFFGLKDDRHWSVLRQDPVNDSKHPFSRLFVIYLNKNEK